MADAEKPERRHLTFEQAEGLEALPTQLRPKEISQELRALLWHYFYESFENACVYSDMGGHAFTGEPWRTILYDKHVVRDHRMADDFVARRSNQLADLKQIFMQGSYSELLGFVEWVLRHRKRPPFLERKVESALKRCRAAYALVDGNTIVPIGSDAERLNIERAFSDVALAEFAGARSHLRKAASELSAGRSVDSIRESIHAVESVARTLEPSASTLGPALSKLEKSASVHNALKSGFEKLYGFTSDEEGIRHALLEKDAAKVDEADALYMLGACAAFVSYLIGKARSAGVLK